jgi:hypothetical protein
MNWIHRGVLRKILNIITYRVTLGPRLAKCGEMQPKLDLILVDNGTPGISRSGLSIARHPKARGN